MLVNIFGVKTLDNYIRRESSSTSISSSPSTLKQKIIIRMVKSRSNSLWFCWMSYLLRILGGILNRSNSKITLGKSSNNTWIFYGQSDRKCWPPHTHLTVSFSWFFWVVYFWPQIINICVLKHILHKKGNFLDDYLQGAGPSGLSFTRGRSLPMIICDHKKGMKNAFLRPFTMR